jgi:hypothetical protein
MPALHDTAFRETLRTRLKSLRPDAKPKWGKMSLDQMLSWPKGAPTLNLQPEHGQVGDAARRDVNAQ